MSQPKITLHWLNASRSHRILWLLEELGLKYDIKLYQRDKRSRAPPELFKVHPLGKSPVVEIEEEDGSKKVLAETGHIVSYLVRKFDTKGQLSGKTEDDKEQIDYFTHYTEGSLQPILVGLFVNDVAKQQTPFGVRFLTSMIVGAINNAYYGKEALLQLQYVDDYLKKQHQKGSKYFVGDSLTVADILMEFPLKTNLFSNPERTSTLLGSDSLESKYPNISEWCKFITKEPGLLRANGAIQEKSKL